MRVGTTHDVQSEEIQNRVWKRCRKQCRGDALLRIVAVRSELRRRMGQRELAGSLGTSPVIGIIAESGSSSPQRYMLAYDLSRVATSVCRRSEHHIPAVMRHRHDGFAVHVEPAPSLY
jgi:hypothetical protein